MNVTTQFRKMQVKLTRSGPLSQEGEIILPTLPALFGRSDEAEVCLDDRWVSRRHCRLEEEAGHLVVRDLGSRHGTYINGKRIEQAELNPGDSLSVGLTRFIAEFVSGEILSLVQRDSAVPQ